MLCSEHSTCENESGPMILRVRMWIATGSVGAFKLTAARYFLVNACFSSIEYQVYCSFSAIQ